LAEARDTGERILSELRKVIPVFLRRVDNPERGGVWTEYLRETADAMAREAVPLQSAPGRLDEAQVALTDFDPDGEIKVLAAALYSHTTLPDEQLLDVARRMSPDERERLLNVYVGKRQNRRHRPGRAFERTRYRFEIVADYGAFRDLQRHRMLTLDWQALSPELGYDMPAEISSIGAGDDWQSVMSGSARVYSDLRSAGLPDVAPYAVSMAYRLRFYMDMDAREAMHIIELRTAQGGHPNYRWLCQEMRRQIADVAGHRAIAAAMSFTDESSADLGRLEAEQRSEPKRASLVSAAE
jgi:hypothetical protein